MRENLRNTGSAATSGNLPAIEPSAPLNPAATEPSPVLSQILEGKKDLLGSVSEHELGELLAVLGEVLENDPRLEGLFAIQQADSSKLSPANIVLPPEFTRDLNPAQIHLFKNLVAFYGSYMAPFPDPSETEPLASLLEYITDKDMAWDIRIGINRNGEVLGAVCGQELDIGLKDGGTLKIAWNEHTYVGREYRGQLIGTQIYSQWENSLSPELQAVFIEIDNPYALSNDPRMLNHDNSDLAAKGERNKLWKDSDQSMDPFDRNNFWGKNGYRVMAYLDTNGDYCAVPYVQISMDPKGLEEPCETLWAGIKIKDPALLKNGTTLPGEIYKSMFTGLQGTIDENLKLYPEFVRTLKQIREIKELVLLDPRTDEGRQAMQNAASKRDELAEAKFDVEYCDKALHFGKKLTDENVEILQSNKLRAKRKLQDV